MGIGGREGREAERGKSKGEHKKAERERHRAVKEKKKQRNTMEGGRLGKKVGDKREKVNSS